MSVSFSASLHGLPEPAGPVIAPRVSAVIIEVADRAVGILAEDGARLRFHAAEARFSALDGQIFRSAGEAERAARRVLDNRKRTHGLASPVREARR